MYLSSILWQSNCINFDRNFCSFRMEVVSKRMNLFEEVDLVRVIPVLTITLIKFRINLKTYLNRQNIFIVEILVLNVH